jgi:hypothetical protein
LHRVNRGQGPTSRRTSDLCLYSGEGVIARANSSTATWFFPTYNDFINTGPDGKRHWACAHPYIWIIPTSACATHQSTTAANAIAQNAEFNNMINGLQVSYKLVSGDYNLPTPNNSTVGAPPAGALDAAASPSQYTVPVPNEPGSSRRIDLYLLSRLRAPTTFAGVESYALPGTPAALHL